MPNEVLVTTLLLIAIVVPIISIGVCTSKIDTPGGYVTSIIMLLLPILLAGLGYKIAAIITLWVIAWLMYLAHRGWQGYD